MESRDAHSIVNSPPWNGLVSAIDGRSRRDLQLELAAETFCLRSANQSWSHPSPSPLSKTLVNDVPKMFDPNYHVSTRSSLPSPMIWITECDDLPKGSQQPVIDDLEEAGHDEIGPILWNCRLDGGYVSAIPAWLVAVQSLLFWQNLGRLCRRWEGRVGGKAGTLPLSS